MPLVKAKCTNCGASLEVDNTKDAAVCPFCKTPYVIEKAINYYYTTNNNNIKADVVNIYSGSEADFVIRAGMLEKYNGASTTVIVPNGVVGIGWKAFEGCVGLESVTIPDSVTQIGERAFYGCESLTDITIPDGVTQIGAWAFWRCESLTDIIIPDGVTQIEDWTFSSCKSLTKAIIPDSVTQIGNRAFYGCENLARVTIPNSVIRIGDSAFSRCHSLTKVTIPNSVTAIGDEAFELCKSLTKVTIPDSVTWIGERAFYNCPITTINASENWKRKNYSCFDKLDCLKGYFPTPQSNNGCYIATCVYGSYDCPQVWTLRRYRDNRLARTLYGRVFINIYYRVSPALVRWFGHTSWFKALWKKRLDRIVAKLQEQGIKGTEYTDIGKTI